MQPQQTSKRVIPAIIMMGEISKEVIVRIINSKIVGFTDAFSGFAVGTEVIETNVVSCLTVVSKSSKVWVIQTLFKVPEGGKRSSSGGLLLVNSGAGASQNCFHVPVVRFQTDPGKLAMIFGSMSSEVPK
jgi:hypothetical protein